MRSGYHSLHRRSENKGEKGTGETLVRHVESRKGTLKKPKDMHGKICLQPFTNIDIQSNYELRCCSESWMPRGIGDFSKNTIMEVWNSETIRNIRRSILNGTYEFCDWHQCPFYCNENRYLYTAQELDAPELRHYRPWISFVKEGETTVSIAPANYNMAYDESCNLECPSCRREKKVYSTGKPYETRKHIQEKFLEELKDIGFERISRVNCSGSGEPFISKVFRNFLFHFNGACRPNIDVNLQSNGIHFTPQTWEKMRAIQNNINEVIISLDASTAGTYRQIRCKGDFRQLLANIEFLSDLRRQNKIRRLMLAYVVQKKNYREMIDAIHLGKKFKIDLFIFNLLNDWKAWEYDEFERNAVWKEYHPEFNEFLKILRDPIFSDPIVDLGNMIEYREIALQSCQGKTGATN
jgi:wyosine [tRNA(Phe)-imidazoG37] synthetase (radical SAM superfamily)